MGPKKKKVNKLAKMSEEEKLRYLQHRAAIEEEQRRRKQQLISTFMKNKLKYEETFTRLNTAKINQQWRQILRQIKCKELRDIAETLKQTFEAAIEAKNNIIDSLLSNLVESEEQRSVALQAHLEAVETLIGFHKERLAYIKKYYSAERSKMMEKANIEIENIIESSTSKTVYLKKRLIKTENETKKTLKKLKNKTLGRRFQLKFKIREEMITIENSGTKAVETLWQQMQQVFNNYKNFLDTMEPEYDRLKQLDNKNREEYKHKNTVIQYYSDTIRRLKKTSSRRIEMYDCQRKQLQDVINDSSSLLFVLRKTVHEENAKDEQQLLRLTAVSNLVINKLEASLKKALLIESLINKCKKLHTEKEKISGFSRPTSRYTELGRSDLSNLWKRLSEVQLECKSLQTHYNTYAAENERLKLFLKQYLNTLARPPSFQRSPNK